MKHGARNQLSGKVVDIRKDDVMSHVKVQLASGETISSVMTSESLEALGIATGSQVSAVVKAVNVLLVAE